MTADRGPAARRSGPFSDVGEGERQWDILVSACLLGTPCRYDGASRPCGELARLEVLGHRLIPVCPEVMGGLPTPRPPAELQRDGRVVDRAGKDVTEAYRLGAEEVLELARAHRCTLAVLKERSPSCGRGQIYDGSFTGRLTEGSGVTARLLEEHGVQVYGESEAGTLAERGEAREEGQSASRPLPSKYPGKND